MFSVIALIALLQAAPAGETAPALADDPIGALIAGAPSPGPPPAPPPAPVRAAPPPPAASPADDEEAAEGRDQAAPATPSAPIPYAGPGPRPYTALPPSTGGIRQIRPVPMVRLPPKPQGVLDGAWVLSRDSGAKLFEFQFNDTGGAGDIEGAWMDARRGGALRGSGPVSSVGSDGLTVTIRFLEPGAGKLSVVTLRAAAGGGWTGEFQGADGSTPVLMRRN